MQFSSWRPEARALCSYMGHASVTITYDRHGHLMPANEDEAAALLDAYLERTNTRACLAALKDGACARMGSCERGNPGLRGSPMVRQ